MYEVTVTRKFSASHALRLGGGAMEPVHGHIWGVEVTVGSEELDGLEMVMDFHELERVVDGLLARVNRKHLNEVEPFGGAGGEMKVNPSAERVAWWLGTEVGKALRGGVKLVGVEVEEAVGCRARWAESGR